MKTEEFASGILFTCKTYLPDSIAKTSNTGSHTYKKRLRFGNVAGDDNFPLDKGSSTFRKNHLHIPVPAKPLQNQKKKKTEPNDFYKFPRIKNSSQNSRIEDDSFQNSRVEERVDHLIKSVYSSSCIPKSILKESGSPGRNQENFGELSAIYEQERDHDYVRCKKRKPEEPLSQSDASTDSSNAAWQKSKSRRLKRMRPPLMSGTSSTTSISCRDFRTSSKSREPELLSSLALWNAMALSKKAAAAKWIEKIPCAIRAAAAEQRKQLPFLLPVISEDRPLTNSELLYGIPLSPSSNEHTTAASAMDCVIAVPVIDL